MKKTFLYIVFFISGLTIYAQLPPWLPVSGLVAWYPFNGNANDESGNAHNGTVNGAALTQDRFADNNKAYSFNGSSNYIEVADHADFQFTNGTISAWVKTAAAGRSLILIKVRWADAYNEQYGIVLNEVYSGSGEIASKYSSSCQPGVGWNKTVAGTSINDDQWHHLVGTINTDSIRLYIDGNWVGAVVVPSSTMDVCSGSNINIGRNWSGDPIYFNGKIDDIGIWNRALTPGEINQLYLSCDINVTSHPVNQLISPGGLTSFMITASGSGNTYQWQQDTGTGFFNVAETAPFSGTTSDTLIINGALSVDDSTYFRCIATAPGGCSDTSNGAFLRVTKRELVFNQVILVTSQQTVPADKVWKIESVAGSLNTQYRYYSSNNADLNPGDCLILINGANVSIAKTMATKARNGNGNGGAGYSGFTYAASSTNLPLWLPEGTTLEASSNVIFISVIEFNLVNI